MAPETPRLVSLKGKENRLNEELSGGEQQRTTIARVFVNRPEIPIAGESMGNPDPEANVGTIKLLDRINRTGTTVAMAIHDSSIMDQMRRHASESYRGELVCDQAEGVYGVN